MPVVLPAELVARVREVAAALPGAVAAFDADGTLWREDIGEAFLKHLVAIGWVRLPDGSDPYQLYEERCALDRATGFAFAAQLQEGLSRAALEEEGARLAARFVPARLIDSSQALLALCREVGLVPVIVSASPDRDRARGRAPGRFPGRAVPGDDGPRSAGRPPHRRARGPDHLRRGQGGDARAPGARAHRARLRRLAHRRSGDALLVAGGGLRGPAGRQRAGRPNRPRAAGRSWRTDKHKERSGTAGKSGGSSSHRCSNHARVPAARHPRFFPFQARLLHHQPMENAPLPCAASSFFRADLAGLLTEPEGARAPDGLELIDSHVHLFPPRVSEAIWRWFDKHAWAIRYRLQAEQVVEFLRARGVSKFCALHYAHRAGMAEALNQFVYEIGRAHPEVIPFATVMPGEPGAREILFNAFAKLDLRGVKLHCHVQQLAADDPRLDEIYQLCQEAKRPVVIHAGREPSFPAYGVDTRALCGADQIDRVLTRYPRLTLIVPHLGADEFEAYEQLLDRHEHLYLDTTMAISEAFVRGPAASLFPGRASRLLYGTDFPNIPYAWDRELKKLLATVIHPDDQKMILSGNAKALFD